MNITVGTADLTKALRRVERIVPAKPSIPILTHVLIHAEDTTVTLSTTDLEVSITTDCEARIDTPGVVAVPAKHLAELVGHISDPETQLFIDKNQAHVRAGSFTSRLQVMRVDDFPPLPVYPGGGVLLGGEEFRLLIRRVRRAITDQDKRYFLDGALLVFKAESVMLVATDGKRLAVANTTCAGAPTLDPIMIPAKTLDVLLQDDSESVSFFSDVNHLFFVSLQCSIGSRVVDGKFPAWQRIIPKDNDKIVTVSREMLLHAVRRVSLASGDSRAVTLAISSGKIDLSSVSAELGDAKETVTAEYDSESLVIITDSKMILDFLETAVNPTVTMQLKDATTQVMLLDGLHLVNVIQLMRR